MQETQETQVPFLDRKDPLEWEMANCCSILAWKIPWKEETGGLQSMRLQRVGHDSVVKHCSLPWEDLVLFVCLCFYFIYLLFHLFLLVGG